MRRLEPEGLEGLVWHEALAIVRETEPVLYEAMTAHDVYTKKGRLNVAAVERRTGMKPKEIKERLAGLREVLR